MIKNAIDIEGKKVIFDINDFDTQVEIHFFSMFPINFENFTKIKNLYYSMSFS